MAAIFNGSRRGRMIGIALLLVFLILFLGYQPSSYGGPRAPVDLHPDDATPHTPSQPQAEPKPPKPEVEHEPEHPHGNEPSKPKPKPKPHPTPHTIPQFDNYQGHHGLDDQDEKPKAPPPGFQEIEVTTEGTATSTTAPPKPSITCLDFETLQRQSPGPASEGRRKFPYVRPPPECRKFHLPSLEALIERMKKVIRDPDLFRLFENSYPNTLDTMVKWRGYAMAVDPETGNKTSTDEELAYIITGDIDAMWLRDSASQIYSYLPLLEASNKANSLASLWRGLINSHARYIIISPYCHSFQPPPESGIPPTTNGAYAQNHPNPPYDRELVFDCKWELDSLASFLQVSAAYYERTGDLDFFGKYRWIEAVKAAVRAAAAMRLGTYDEHGRVLPSAWTFTGWTNRGSETLTNDGLGNPVRENGMVRTAFRPSDDACIFQLLTPANMMFAAYLEQASVIMEKLAKKKKPEADTVMTEMRLLAASIRHGIARDAVVSHRDYGEIFAYEVDGFGGANLMDDANVPSLLAMPLWNFTRAGGATRMVKSVHSPRTARKAEDDKKKKIITAEMAEEEEAKHDYAKIYQNTRKFALGSGNPYWAEGPVLAAVGGPHLGPGKGWPMAATVAALTAMEDISGIKTQKERDEVVGKQLFQVLNSTSGTGVVHETVHAWKEYQWTRSWFGWANGLFGELILKIADDEERRGVLGKEEGLLGRMWQD